MNIVLALAGLIVSYANGANDNFKGVATLYGGRVLSYVKALQWASVCTFAGSILSLFLSTKLLVLFSGKGIVRPSVLNDPSFLIAVALGAAATVLFATRIGFPISTTHSLIGALTGAGIAGRGILSFSALGGSFFLPLLIGPLIAVTATTALYAVLHVFRKQAGIESTYCLCIGERQELLVGTPGLLVIRSSGVQIAVEDEKHCRMIYPGAFVGVALQKVMDSLHVVSAGAVSFARGLNDTPKIAALLLSASFVSQSWIFAGVALLMMIGGAIHSRRIANRMSFEITDMNPGQAFTANLVTSILVIAGSVAGFPLSTTHVSCGSIFGIGAASRQVRFRVLGQIVAAWIITLPTSALLAAIFWWLLR